MTECEGKDVRIIVLRLLPCLVLLFLISLMVINIVLAKLFIEIVNIQEKCHIFIYFFLLGGDSEGMLGWVSFAVKYGLYFLFPSYVILIYSDHIR